jgi:hypothetical protein
MLIPEALAELSNSVTPAKAGVQKLLKNLDSGFRRNLSCNGLRPVE